MKAKFNVPLTLIVVDTMSAGFEDENSAAQAQPVMDALHALSRAAGALVVAVDHFGKAGGSTRGSSAKEGSADAVLKLERDPRGRGYVMTVRKLRSGPTGQQFGYVLKPVSFGLDEDGEDITTCVVEFGAAQVSPATANIWHWTEDLKKCASTGIRSVSCQRFTMGGNRFKLFGRQTFVLSSTGPTSREAIPLKKQRTKRKRLGASSSGPWAQAWFALAISTGTDLSG